MSFPASCPDCGSAIRFTSDSDGVAQCPGCGLTLRLGSEEEPVCERLDVDAVLIAAQSVGKFAKATTTGPTVAPTPNPVLERPGTSRATACVALLIAAVLLLFILPWPDAPDPDGEWSDIPPPPFDGKLPDPEAPPASKYLHSSRPPG